MVHFFATMIREPYDFHRDISEERWFNPNTQTGLLAKYLMDPDHFFMDELSKNLLVRKDRIFKKNTVFVILYNFFAHFE